MLTLQILIDNQIGVLEKILTILSRNRASIKHLHIADAVVGPLSLITCSTNIDAGRAEKLRLQMIRINEVAEVKVLFYE